MMRLPIVFAAILLLPSAFPQTDSDFHTYFVDRTLRYDYFHTGTKGVEHFSEDEVLIEGPWPGSAVNLIDTLDQGEYQVRVHDLKSGTLIYSRGFSSVFQEWQTTDEALKGTWRSISETVRFPLPKRPVQVMIWRRDKQGVMHEAHSRVIDPARLSSVNAERRSRNYEVVELMNNGDSHKKVDIVILAEGYTKDEIKKFKEDAKHFNDVMFGTSPFKERRNDFNVRALCVVSEQSGIDVPDQNVWKNTALSTSYFTFGSERYVLTTANKDLRDIAGQVPYDFVTILLNDSRYGGGGIFQQFTTTFTISDQKGMEWQRDYVYVHEFGHSFTGLADEYYSSSTGYNDFYPEGVEPWEPNITRLYEPENIKWKDLVTPGVQVPTEWNKTLYDSLGIIRASLDRLAPDYYTKREPIKTKQDAITSNTDLSKAVGAFEGAGYLSKGMYRPALDCRMFSLSLTDFCPVCRKALERQIDFYSR